VTLLNCDLRAKVLVVALLIATDRMPTPNQKIKSSVDSEHNSITVKPIAAMKKLFK
jgi:hypothetical protein